MASETSGNARGAIFDESFIMAEVDLVAKVSDVDRPTNLFDNNLWCLDSESIISFGFLRASLDRAEGVKYISYCIFESCIGSGPRSIRAEARLQRP